MKGGCAVNIATALIEAIVFSGDDSWEDEAIGKQVLAARLAAEGAEREIPADQIPAELVERWVIQIAAQETDSAMNIPLEKALHLAARGEFARAGAIFRASMLDSAVRVHANGALAAQIDQKERQSVGGSKGAKAATRPRKLPTNLLEQLRKLTDTGKSEQDARSVLTARYGVTSEAVRKALKQAQKNRNSG